MRGLVRRGGEDDHVAKLAHAFDREGCETESLVTPEYLSGTLTGRVVGWRDDDGGGAVSGILVERGARDPEATPVVIERQVQTWDPAPENRVVP